MNDKARHLFEYMDNNHWVRMAVCFVPALVIAKIAAIPDAPSAIKVIGGLTIAIGGGVYFGWGFIRKRILGINEVDEHEQVEDGEPVALARHERTRETLDASVHIQMLAEMKTLCNEDFGLVIRSLQTEADIHPEYALTAVIEEAYHRRRHTVKNQSGS